MAVTQVNSYSPGNTDLENLQVVVDTQRRQGDRVSLTNMANTNLPAVEEGSIIEINGALFEVQSADAAISGWSGIADDTEVYIKATVSGTVVTFSFTGSAPAWDMLLGGWYLTGDKYLPIKLYRTDATTYSKKKHIPIPGVLDSFAVGIDQIQIGNSNTGSQLRITDDASDIEGMYVSVNSSSFDLSLNVERTGASEWTSRVTGNVAMINVNDTDIRFQAENNLTVGDVFTPYTTLIIDNQDPDNFELKLRKVAGSTTRLSFGGTGATDYRRWMFKANNTAEGGLDVGSDLEITNHNDTGTEIGTPIFIKRDTGNVIIGSGTTPITDQGHPLQIYGAGTDSQVRITEDTTNNDGLYISVPNLGSGYIGTAEYLSSAWKVRGDAAAMIEIDSESVPAIKFYADDDLVTDATWTPSIIAQFESGGVGSNSYLKMHKEPSGSAAIYFGIEEEDVRWILDAESTPESGSNAGSDFRLRSYADDGTTDIGTPFFIYRATGSVVLGSGTSVVDDQGQPLQVYGVATDSQVRITESTTTNRGMYFSVAGETDSNISFDAENVAGSWTARSSYASVISVVDDEIGFYLDSGLTGGNTFTPTKVIEMVPSGIKLERSGAVNALDPTIYVIVDAVDSTVDALSVSFNYDATAADSATYSAGRFKAENVSTVTGDFSGTNRALEIWSTINKSLGDATGNVIGVEIYHGTRSSFTGTLAQSAGLLIYPIVQAGTVTDSYDIHMTAQSGAGTITNRWGIYQEPIDSPNYFGSDLLIGTSTDYTYTAQTIPIQTLGTWAVVGRSVDTDATAKDTGFGLTHFTSAQEPVTMIYAYSSATVSNVYIGGGTTEGNAATSIRFFAAASTTITTGTEIARITEDGLLIGTTADETYSTNTQAIQALGVWALVGRTVDTDDAAKTSRIGVLHYHNATEEPVSMIHGVSDGTNNKVIIGGGSTAGNAATLIQFYAAANDATVTGTEIAYIDIDGMNILANASTDTASLDMKRPKIVTTDDEIGRISASGYSTGTTYVDGGYIDFVAESLWTATSAETRIDLFTTPSASVTPVETLSLTRDCVYVKTDTLDWASNGMYYNLELNNNVESSDQTIGSGIAFSSYNGTGNRIASVLNVAGEGFGFAPKIEWSLDANGGASATSPYKWLEVSAETDTMSVNYGVSIKTSSAANKPALIITQQNSTQDFLRLSGNSVNAAITGSLVDEGDQSGQTLEGWIRIYVTDTANNITDATYHIPFYTLT